MWCSTLKQYQQYRDCSNKNNKNNQELLSQIFQTCTFDLMIKVSHLHVLNDVFENDT